MATKLTIPLFPLHTVLFPDAPLSLRVFEPRYLDLVSRCLREDGGFGVCLIREGEEVGEVAEVFGVGTVAKIVNWEQREDGLLGILAQGQQSFHILTQRTGPNRLIEAEVELHPPEADLPLPEKYAHFADILRKLLSQIGSSYPFPNPDYSSAVWVSHRLAELLPVALVQRQFLLELSDPYLRLHHIEQLLRVLELK